MIASPASPSFVTSTGPRWGSLKIPVSPDGLPLSIARAFPTLTLTTCIGECFFGSATTHRTPPESEREDNLNRSPDPDVRRRRSSEGHAVDRRVRVRGEHGGE